MDEPKKIQVGMSGTCMPGVTNDGLTSGAYDLQEIHALYQTRRAVLLRGFENDLRAFLRAGFIFDAASLSAKKGERLKLEGLAFLSYSALPGQHIAVVEEMIVNQVRPLLIEHELLTAIIAFVKKKSQGASGVLECRYQTSKHSKLERALTNSGFERIPWDEKVVFRLRF